jgi:hypothetical protein
MNIDDAVVFIVDFLKNPRNDGHSTYGYEIYMPVVITAYIVEIKNSQEHPSFIYNSQQAITLSPTFYEAAWELCRRGVLRPGIQKLGGQATDDGASRNGYSLTQFGRDWLEDGAQAAVLLEPGRMGELFKKLSNRFSPGFSQRANEAIRCHSLGAYLACCAMCGAAVESILLSVAIAKTGDEAGTLATYRGTQGRRKLIDSIIGQARQPIAGPFRTVTGLLTYWRDDAAHGLASTISEIEAHEALIQLIRFSQFTNDNWTELTRK